MSAQGHACINHKKNKHSYVVLIDPAGGFSAATTVVDPVFDNSDPVNPLEWTPSITSWKATVLKVRLKCTVGRALAPRKKKPHRVFMGVGPDTGTLTITLTGGPIVDPVQVNYVNDNTPP